MSGNEWRTASTLTGADKEKPRETEVAVMVVREKKKKKMKVRGRKLEEERNGVRGGRQCERDAVTRVRN